MTIYQRMLSGAGLLRAPETGGGQGGGDGGAGGQQQQTPPKQVSVLGTGGGQQQQQQNGDGQQQQQNGGAADWFAKLSGDAEMKAWAESKGWRDAGSADPLAIAQSYYNLEKLFGADKAGRTIQLPKDASDKAAIDAIYEKLGRPKDASGYQIDLPEGASPEFANAAKGWFHKAGLTADQAKAVTESYRALELDATQKVETDHAQQVEALQKEWGAQFDQKVEIARAALKAAGLTEQRTKAVELALGPAEAAKLFEFFGRNYVEGGPPGNEQRGAPSFSNVTPGAAKQKMDALRADQNFMSRYNSNDPKVRAAAIQEMDDLAKVAVNVKA